MRALLLACVGCASGGRPDQLAVDAAPTVDGSGSDAGVIVDAPPGAMTRTLSQTTTMAIEGNRSIACPASPGTAANNYYRVFDLAALGITTPFKVTQVSFGVEHCDQINGAAGTTVAVRVGTYNGTPGNQLELSAMTILASNPTVQVPEVIETNGVTPGGTVNAPISATIPAGQKLLVEIDAPNGQNQYFLYLGANDDGEAAPAYVLAPSCTQNGMPISKPTNINTLSATAPAVHLLITVTGQYGP